jgi:hypothetical protein
MVEVKPEANTATASVSDFSFAISSPTRKPLSEFLISHLSTFLHQLSHLSFEFFAIRNLFGMLETKIDW